MSASISSMDLAAHASRAPEKRPVGEHITVCICTYKRPEMLRRLLPIIEDQRTEGMFTLSVVVVDNDAAESARVTAEAFAQRSSLRVVYAVEPKQNIAMARNRAIEHAEGEYVALIDDDELPGTDWLLRLYRACQLYRSDGVLAPVLPHFEAQPPEWVTKGRIFERPSHQTGEKLDWPSTRTGNALLQRRLFACPENRFNPLFGSGGEDRDFFRRMIAQGHLFVWSQEASVYETIAPIRWRRSFLVRRALLRGQVSMVNPGRSVAGVARSLCAILIYIPLLPLLLLVAHHLFMKYLIKTGDHVGRLLAAAGIRAVKQKYVM